MEIIAIDTELYRLPLVGELTDSRHGVMKQFEVVLVKLGSDNGEEGVGYTYTIGVGGSAIKALVDDTIRELLVGQDADRIESLWDTMWWKLHYIGRGGIASFAMSAVDLALWDLRGKSVGLPLWKLLGGASPEITPYAGGIDLYFPMERLLDQTRDNLAAGFKAIKMKVGRHDYREDVERVTAVRNEIGSNVDLMVDCNMQWTTSTAIQFAKDIRDLEIYWFEEPTIPDDYAAHARIQAEGGVPVATGENLRTLYEFRHMIESGGVSFPEPDFTNCGGITGWMRVAKLAYAHNLPVTTHGVHEIHLHLLAAIRNSSYLECHGFGLDRYMTNPPVMNDGVMVAGEQPGHGVAFDWEKLAEDKGKTGLPSTLK